MNIDICYMDVWVTYVTGSLNDRFCTCFFFLQYFPSRQWFCIEESLDKLASYMKFGICIPSIVYTRKT